jgi:O-antigen/teichoic acid export membrane protein
LKNDIYKVFKHTVIYGLGKSSEQFAKFLLLPLYTRFLTPSDYGILSLVSFFTGFVGIIFGLGTSSSVFRFYRTSDNQNQQQEAFYSSLILILVWCSIVLMAIYPFNKIISQVLFDSEDYGKYIMIGLGSSALVSIYSIPMFILRAEERSVLFVSNNIFKLLLSVGLGVTFVVLLKRAALGALEAGLLTAIIFTVYTITRQVRRSGFGFNWSLLIKLLKYGSPFIISGFGFVILNSSDKYFLKKFTTLDQVGIYSVGYTLGTGVMLIIGAFQNAWPQLMFDYRERSDAGEFYGKVLTYYVGIMGIIWLGIALFSKEIVMLMTPEKFWDAYRVIPLISLAFIFTGAASILSSGIYTRDKTYNELIINPIAAGLCLGLNFIFISKWGMIGAAWATLISFVGSFFLYSFRAAKYLKIAVQWKKVLGVLFIIIIALVATLLSPFSGIFIVVCTKVAILSVVIVIMLKSNLFFRLECIHLLRHYRKLFNQ